MRVSVFQKFLLFNLFTISSLVQIASQNVVELETVASGFTAPTDIAHANDGRLYVVEQPGRIFILEADFSRVDEPFLDISGIVGSNGNEQGLLGLAFHPEYQSNRKFYLNYTDNSGNTVVSEFLRNPDNPNIADTDSERQLLSIEQPFTNHNGGDLVFGPDGYLYISTGDGGSGGDPLDNGQNRLSLLGKILRIDVDSDDPYGIPDDNPFAGDDFTLDEIWALGLRNPWRISFDRQTGDLYIADVGQREFEELNFERAGSPGGYNYGWRCYEGFAEFNTDDCNDQDSYRRPVAVYPHEVATCTGSITGGYVYRGNDNPALYGKYIFIDYCTGKMRMFTPEDSTVALIGEFDNSFVTTFGEDTSGELYVATSSGDIMVLNQLTSIRGTRSEEPTIETFPNPSNGLLYLKSENPHLLSEIEHVEIFALSGKMVRAYNGSSSNGLDISGLQSGLYIIVVKGGDLTYTAKVVVQ